MRTQKLLVNMIKRAVGNPKSGAEVGVCMGTTAKYMLDQMPTLQKLLLVDPWKEWPEGSTFYNHRRIGNLKQDKWDEMYREVLDTFCSDGSKYRNKVIVERTVSKEAALARQRNLEKNALDFVFIDADHTFDAVKEDIECWLPVVRAGGIICGHDYGGSSHDVKPAVDSILPQHMIIIPGCYLWGYIKT